MKLTLVEISGFRIFDKATFNFTNKIDQPFDFVSIYAPNGFGKTSFYDAVEWGMTNSINRFQVKRGENLRQANIQTGSDIIKRLGSSQPTKVTIYKDKGKPQTRQLSNRHKNQDLFKSKIQNQSFQSVILSQEWISSFLTEADGKMRLKKFMEKPDLHEIYTYYNKIKRLIAGIDDEIKTNDSKLNELNKEIKNRNLEDANIVEVVNSHVTKLIDLDEKISPLMVSTTEKEVAKFIGQVSNRIVETKTEKSAADLELSNVSIARSGNKDLSGIEIYFENLSTLNKSKEEIEKIGQRLNRFRELSEQNLILNKLSDERNLAVNRRENLSKLISGFEAFESLQNLKTQIEKEEKESHRLTEELTNEKKTESEINANILFTDNEIQEKRVKLKEIPKLGENFDRLTKQVGELSEREKSLNIDLAKQNHLFASANEQIEKIRLATSNINDGLHSELNHSEFPDHAIVLAELSDAVRNSKELKSEIKILNDKIEAQELFNSEISDFIQAGLKIVNDLQNPECPLCEHEYPSFEELANRVANNRMLEKQTQVLLTEKNLLMQQEADIRLQIEQKNELLLEFLREKLDSLISLAATSKNAVVKQNDELKKIKATLESLKSEDSELSKIQSELNGLSLDGYKSELESQLEELEAVKKNLLQKSSAQNKIIKPIEKRCNANSQLLNDLAGRLTELQQEDNYKRINSWFNEEAPNSIREKATIESSLAQIEVEIVKISTKIDDADQKVKELSEILLGFDEVKLNEDKSHYDSIREQAIASTEIYKQFLLQKLSLDIDELEKTKLLNLLAEKEKNLLEIVSKLKNLHSEYEKIEKVSNKLIPFLQTRKLRSEIQKIENELQFKTNSVKKLLDEEKNGINKFFENRVKDFFYEELTNQLYRKIDPHPDFREIKFKADFEGDHPVLDISARNLKSDELEIIPNLYFSTAQINILSLSIFLASAMNSKEYDCIFIDDPIQSMDSINILSTIDLLRSIVVNHGKQIILSTHDENFHNLLKKKIPADLFNSKFIEFESFGKLKK